jgi:hypothetical protein
VSESERVDRRARAAASDERVARGHEGAQREGGAEVDPCAFDRRESDAVDLDDVVRLHGQCTTDHLGASDPVGRKRDGDVRSRRRGVSEGAGQRHPVRRGGGGSAEECMRRDPLADQPEQVEIVQRLAGPRTVGPGEITSPQAAGRDAELAGRLGEEACGKRGGKRSASHRTSIRLRGLAPTSGSPARA